MEIVRCAILFQSDRCYCRTTTPHSSQQRAEDECTSKCPGKLSEICGRSFNRATVYIIDRTPEPVTTKITQMTTATSLATEEMPTTTSTEMITTDTSPEKATTESFRTSSENLPYSISTVTSQTSTYTNTDVALSTTDRVNQKKMLCECPQSLVNTKWHFLDEMDITDSEATEIILQHFYQNILPEITVDKKAVTKEVRKRTSAVNKTQPAQFIGWGCILILDGLVSRGHNITVHDSAESVVQGILQRREGCVTANSDFRKEGLSDGF
ncbi:CD224 [Mytilus edulis]|uniref:GGT1_5 n=1 Tax=Mytilus edulis TaxID=6550 RepID=A0A8S3UEW2_MYTED|nr:CD224 [Mytilus edulis]